MIKMHNTENTYFVILIGRSEYIAVCRRVCTHFSARTVDRLGQYVRVFAGVYVRTFQPELLTGWGSQGRVKPGVNTRRADQLKFIHYRSLSGLAIADRLPRDVDC